jgi:hypothetical protein
MYKKNIQKEKNKSMILTKKIIRKDCCKIIITMQVQLFVVIIKNKVKKSVMTGTPLTWMDVIKIAK